MAMRRPPGHGASGVASCVVITVSDTRGPRDDASGDTLARGLERAGHRVLSRAWVKDDVAAIRRAVRGALGRRSVEAVLLTGGTGVAPRDRTPEAVAPLLDTELPGFGELFRALSYRQVGAAAWLSRAGAGVARGRLVIWLPGSTRAVALAISKLVAPELGHAIRLLKHRPEPGA
jgi:molybdenum cofactor biosynthesis protein B